MVKLRQKPANTNINIALTGLMGSGKSTVGRYLAHQLKKTFIDTDALIEEIEGRTINEIFEKEGEEYFRDLERRIIEKVMQAEGQIISLGGGAIVSDANRSLIKTNSKLIALVADPKDLFDRIKRRKNRPLLNEEIDPLVTLEELWKNRKSAYMDSHIQIDTTDKSVNLISQEIIKTLGLKKPRIQEQYVDISRSSASYGIYYKDLDRINLDLIGAGKQVLIVSQEPVAKHYLETLKSKLSQDHTVNTMVIEDGEKAKNFFTFQLIIQKLLSLNFERKDTLIALGGGVVGDVVGFAASTYYRGINYVQVPTTLLAMIDSSVGGKTAINVPEGKNLVGTFYQPHMVHIDLECLKTLSDREYRCGLGEMVKYTMLGAKWDDLLGDSFFDFMVNCADEIANRDLDVLNHVINHCLTIKAGVVTEDETEKGIRAHLNLGHTFGHAIEEVTQYERFSHGEAVAVGLISSCYLAEELGMLSAHHTSQVIELMQSLGLEYKIPSDIKTEDIIKAFKYDKKVEDGISKFVVPKMNIGRVEVVSRVEIDQMAKAIDRNR